MLRSLNPAWGGILVLRTESAEATTEPEPAAKLREFVNHRTTQLQVQQGNEVRRHDRPSDRLSDVMCIDSAPVWGMPGAARGGLCFAIEQAAWQSDGARRLDRASRCLADVSRRLETAQLREFDQAVGEDRNTGTIPKTSRRV